jgi:hypothetical protein
VNTFFVFLVIALYEMDVAANNFRAVYPVVLYSDFKASSLNQFLVRTELGDRNGSDFSRSSE